MYFYWEKETLFYNQVRSNNNNVETPVTIDTVKFIYSLLSWNYSKKSLREKKSGFSDKKNCRVIHVEIYTNSNGS